MIPVLVTAYGGNKIDETRPADAFDALVDTGATVTCVSPRAADKLEIVPIDKKDVQTAGGVFPKNVYRVNIHIPVPYSESASKPKINLKSFFQLDVMEADLPGKFDVLLGMDVILHGSFHVSGEYFTICN